VEPIAGAIVSKGIRFSISGPECNDPATCYPVGESDVTANIDLNNDASHVLPGSFLMVGFLEDFGQGIWDIPARSLTASSSTNERAFTPSYIMMPPGTTSTFELVDWIARNNDLFDPEKGGVSPGIYRFETARDAEGFPYCSIPGGEPVGAYVTTTRGCVAPFDYRASSAASQYQLGGSAQERAKYPSQCTSQQGVLVYASRASELVTPTLDSSVNSNIALNISSGNFGVQFQYYKDSFSSDVGAVDVLEIGSTTQIFRIGINGAGNVRATLSATSAPTVITKDSATTIGTLSDLRDGVWHTVLVTGIASGGQFSVGVAVDGITLARVFSFANTMTGASPFVRRIADITQSSAGALVRDVVLLNSGFLSANLASSYLHMCALPNQGGGRCSAGNTESIVFASRNVTSTEGVTCDASSVLVSVTAAIDVVYPRDPARLAGAMGANWSVTGWIKASNTLVSGVLALLVAGRGSVSISAPGGVRVNNIAINAPQLTNGVSHYFAVVYNAQSATATLYVDQTLVGSVSAPQLAQAASASFSRPVANQYVSMLKVYNSALTVAQLNVEGLCQVSSKLGSLSFAAPAGACAVAGGSNYGYCREPLMCNGHCGAYSAIDRSTGTFTPLVNECDDGWAPPACTTRCGRIDPQTGECLDKLGKSAVGLTPAGVVCPLASNFKLSTVASTKLFGATPRYWQYTVSVGVPAGVITNIIETGACPLATITPNIDGSFLVNLQNNNNAVSIVNVLYAPFEVFTGELACESPCCSLAVDAPVTIAANSVFSFAVPAANCGNISVIVQQAVNTFDPFANTTIGSTQECSRFDGNQIDLILNTAFNQAVPTNVQSQIQVSQNTVALGIKNTADALGLQLVNLLALGAESNFQGEGFKTTLALQAQAIRDQTFNPINFTTSLPPYSIQGAVDNLNNVTAAGSAALSRTVAAFTANENARQTLEISAREQSANLSILIAQTDRQLAATVKAYEDSLVNFPSGGLAPSFVDIIKEIGDGAAQAALAAANVGKTFIDSALDIVGLPGKLLGGFGKLLSGFFAFLLYYLIVKLAGAAFSAGAPAATAAISQGFERLRPNSKYTELPLSEPNPIRPPSAATGIRMRTNTGDSPRSGSEMRSSAFVGTRFTKAAHRNRLH
jgi:hypothetical protein